MTERPEGRGRDALRILSIDHGAHDLVPLAVAAGAEPARLPRFKAIAATAAARVAAGRPGYGMFLDGDLGAAALGAARRHGLWIAVQYPHGDVRSPAAVLDGWPRGEAVKVILNARADARTPLAERMPQVVRIAQACRASGHRLLVEALAAEGEPVAELVARIRDLAIVPAWWLVEAQATREEWHALSAAACAGAADARIIVIARSAEVAAPFALAAGIAGVVGFVGGRSLFGPALASWLAGRLDDDAAAGEMARRFTAMASAWDAGASA